MACEAEQIEVLQLLLSHSGVGINKKTKGCVVRNLISPVNISLDIGGRFAIHVLPHYNHGRATLR